MKNKANKSFYIIILWVVISNSIISCTTWQDETIESSYIIPTLPDPEYKFSRNNESSVDLLECSLLKEPVDIIYQSFMKEARISNGAQQERMNEYFKQGVYGKAPFDEIATSMAHRVDRERVLATFQQLFNDSRTLSGYGYKRPADVRNTKAQTSKGGYLGYNIGDVNLAFVNNKGLAVAEVYNEMIRGSIYLDKILNVHLNPQLYNDQRLLKDQESSILVNGHNYTELEHHWDLAYGYYQYWLPIVQKNERNILKGSRIKLYNAFAIGRLAMTEYRFDEMRKCLDIIRQELSKVATVHAIQLLSGEITKVNLDEDISNALVFLSRAYGAIFSLQFAVNIEGKPLYTFDEVQTLLGALTQNSGLWDKQRLEGDSTITGSIAYTVAQIKQRIL